MKKFILPLLLVLSLSMLIAVESEASDVVGYFKKSIPEGGWKSFVLPFAYAPESMTPTAIFGDQFADADQISEIREGIATDYIDGYGWYGDLETFDYGYGYYAVRADGNGPLDYFIMGKVDPQPFTTYFPTDSWSAFGLNEASDVYIADLFGTNPTDGDVLSDVDDGTASDYIDGYGWYGDLEIFEPTRAYFYVTSPDSPGFEWTYPPSETRQSTNGISNQRKNLKK